MYRRLIILTAIVVAAVCGLGGLGFHAIAKWAEGLEGVRLGEFAEVAEQVRQDVKRKLDEFIEVEQQRKYSDYLYSYVPENIVDAQQLSLVRSPLGDRMSNEFAYGYFQVEPDGTIVTPYSPADLPTPTARMSWRRRWHTTFRTSWRTCCPRSARERAGPRSRPSSPMSPTGTTRQRRQFWQKTRRRPRSRR